MFSTASAAFAPRFLASAAVCALISAGAFRFAFLLDAPGDAEFLAALAILAAGALYYAYVADHAPAGRWLAAAAARPAARGSQAAWFVIFRTNLVFFAVLGSAAALLAEDPSAAAPPLALLPLRKGWATSLFATVAAVSAVAALSSRRVFKC
jgi:hypothetical protein